MEVFSGTGGLTAAIRHIGLTHSIGVDAHVTKRVKSPIIRLDLTSEHGLELLWRILQQDNLAAVHLGPPCGTSSRARDSRRRFGSDPKPLRSVQHPDGLPWLQGLDLQRVLSANKLYDITGQIFAWCCDNGILCTIKNPVRSHMWRTSHLSRHLHGRSGVVEVCFHACMFLAKRKKRTKLLCNNHTCHGGSQVVSGQQHRRLSIRTNSAKPMPKFAITCFYNMEPLRYHSRWTLIMSTLLKPVVQPWEHNPVARNSSLLSGSMPPR